MTESDIQEIIFGALGTLNLEFPADRQVPLAATTRLFGVEAELDSLSLVSLILDVETAIEAATGRTIGLADDRAMSQPVSPYTDVATLTAYIGMLLREPG